MLPKVKADIEKYGMLSNGDTVTVALSGGADSVALLNIMLALKDEYELSVNAVHINHMLRGDESDRDELFVRNLCDSLNVPLTVKKIDVAEKAKSSKESIELCARRVRYEVFDGIDGKIATAHTANDNAETVILNLTRGTSLKGVCGIPALRGKYIRPLISQSREDIENYCKSVGVSFVTDSSNLSDEYTRNKIRHNCLPVLRAINPDFAGAVTRFSYFAAADNDYLDGVADNLYGICCCDGVLRLEDGIHPSVLYRVISKYLYEKTGIVPDGKHILAVADALKNDSNVSLQNDCIAVVCNHTVSVYNGKKPIDSEFSSKMQEIDIEKFKKMLKVNSLLLKNAVDCDKIQGKCVLRTRQTGDFIHIYGRNAGKSLKKLYNEEKIPLTDRKNLPVAADRDGVIWIYSVGVEQRVAVDNNTKRVLLFTADTKSI